jgi:hypothetical protein
MGTVYARVWRTKVWGSAPLQLERPLGDRPEPAGRLLLVPVGIYIEAVRLDLEPSRYCHPDCLHGLPSALGVHGQPRQGIDHPAAVHEPHSISGPVAGSDHPLAR